jgi:pimeloyl-ACP methyl ester carboxylesterase
MASSAVLGPVRDVDLGANGAVRIRYHETGSGPAVVFVHGLLVNADLWRTVVPGIAAAGYRCIAPDWPLGSHEVAVPGADLTPTGIADLIASFLEALDLRDVTLVANDTGGAMTQILMSRDHDRVGRVVLTPSDCYENFFPPVFAGLTYLARIPGSIRPLTELMRIRALHRLPIAFGWVAKRPVPPHIADSYLLPSRRDAAVRRDLRRFLRSVHKRYTLGAAESFGRFTKPVLLVWASEDRLFPLRLGTRLAADLPNATLTVIDDSYTFVPEDQPQLLTERILEFTRLHAPS